MTPIRTCSCLEQLTSNGVGINIDAQASRLNNFIIGRDRRKAWAHLPFGKKKARSKDRALPSCKSCLQPRSVLNRIGVILKIFLFENWNLRFVIYLELGACYLGFIFNCRLQFKNLLLLP